MVLSLAIFYLTHSTAAAGSPLDTGTVTAILSVILGAIGIAVTVAIWKASGRAIKTQEAEKSPAALLRQVDEEAYERARKIYEAAIDQLEEELNRASRMARELQAEVYRLNSELIRVRAKLHPRDITDPDSPIDPGSP